MRNYDSRVRIVFVYRFNFNFHSEREEHDVSHVPCRPWCRFCYGYLSGDSTPLLAAKERHTGTTFAAADLMKGGGDPHAARLLSKWIDGLGCQEVTVRTDGEPSICELVCRVRELRAEGTDHCGLRSVRQVILLPMGLLREPF